MLSIVLISSILTPLITKAEVPRPQMDENGVITFSITGKKGSGTVYRTVGWIAHDTPHGDESKGDMAPTRLGQGNNS